MKILINIISWIAFPVAFAWSLKTKFDYEPLLSLLASTIGILTTFDGGNQNAIRARVQHNTQTNLAYLTKIINIIPFGKYVLTVLLFVIVAAIISALKLDDFKFNYLGFGALFAFSILIFVGSKFNTSSDPFLKNSGRALIVVIPFLFISCASFLVSSVFFDWPKRFCEYFSNCKEDTGFIMPQIDTCQVHILVSDYVDEGGKNGSFGSIIASEIENKLERLNDSFPKLKDYINPITKVHEKVDKNNYEYILKKYNADIIFFGTYFNPLNDTSKFYTNVFMDADFTQRYFASASQLLKQSKILSLNLSDLIGQESEKIIYYLSGTIVCGLDKCIASDSTDFKLSESLLKKSYEIETNSKFDLWVASTYFFVLQNISEYDKAISVYSNLLNNQLLGESEKPIIYNELGDIYSRINNYALARKYFNKSISFYENKKDTSGLVSTFNMLGDLLINMNENDSATYYFNWGLQNKIYSDSSTIAKLKNGLATTYLIDGKYLESLPLFFEATQLYRNTNQLLGEAISLGSTAQAYVSLDSLDLAMKYLIESLKISERNNFKDEIARSYWLMSSIHRKQKNYQLGIENLNTCLSILEDIGFNDRIPATYYYIALNFKGLQKIDSCRIYLKKAIVSSKKRGDQDILNLATTEMKKLK